IHFGLCAIDGYRDQMAHAYPELQVLFQELIEKRKNPGNKNI
ncbi:MAG: hypothetical protein RL295_399, partial [Pseudomonadota bacterium]